MPQTSASVRWRAILPTVMVVVSTFLTLFAQAQQRTMQSGGMGTDVPARVIDAVINGPGFALPVRLPVLAAPESSNWMLYYDSQRLVGIGVFWILMGWAIDRRNKPIFSRRYSSIAAAIFTLAAVACGVLAAMLSCELMRTTDLNYPVRTWRPLRSTGTIAVGWTMWLLGFFAYFTRKSFAAWKYLNKLEIKN